MTAMLHADELRLALPASKAMDARRGDKTIAVRLEPMRSPWETTDGWPNPDDRGVVATDGPGGTALQFATGYAIYDGLEPIGGGRVWTVAFWFRPDEPDWGVWQEPWNSKRDPKNMFFFAKPTLMHFGTFLTRAWEIRLCRNRLEFLFGDWAAAGATRLKVGQWTHVAMARDGDRLAVYVNGQPEPLARPERVDGATGAVLPLFSEPLPPFASARLNIHPSDGMAGEGRYPTLVLGHSHDSAGYQDKFIGALGPVVMENRVWTQADARADWERARADAERLSIRYSTLTDPVGGRSRRPDKQTETAAEYLKRIAWFREARYGLFMHWNPCSVAAVEISWGRGAGPDQLAPEKYDALYRQFNPTNFNPRQWARDARAGGLRYMVWTAKHHDGFMMWDSKLSSYTIAAGPWGKDIVRQYVDALRKAGMPVGLYFSPRDWWWAANRPELTGTDAQKTNLVAYVEGQLEELCSNYGCLDVLWFDGGVGNEAGMYREIIGPKQRRVVANDRNGPGDYATPEGQIPLRPLFNPDGSDRLWESCIPMGNGGWSYRNDEVMGYEELIREMVEIFAKGGNLLRNIGPRPTGEWSPPARDRILQIGKWIEINGESVYGTHRTRLGRQPWGWATANAKTLYLHILRWPGRELRVEGLNDRVKKARLLDGGVALKFTQDGDALTLELPETAPDPADTVIALSI